MKSNLDVQVNGDLKNNLSHNLNLYIKGTEAKAVLNLIKNNLAISAGSACSTENVKPSHVLMALGYEKERAFSSLRFGLLRDTTEEDIDNTILIISKAVKKLKMLN